MTYEEQVREWARHAQLNGCKRVLVDPDGRAVSCWRASRDHRVRPDIVLIRDDGWTLGCTSDMERIAWNLWPGLWAGRMDVGTLTLEIFTPPPQGMRLRPEQLV